MAHLDDSQLRAFIKVNNTNGKASCIVCLKEFSRKDNALEHIKRVHVCNFSLKCNYCPLLFKSSHHRGVHVKRKHAVEHRVQKALMMTEPSQK